MLRVSKIPFLTPTLGCRSITSTTPTGVYDHRAISDGHKATEHRRKPARGGQNLSDRYIRLEKSLRGKEAFSDELNELAPSAVQMASGLKAYQKPLQIFRGFQIPKEPKPPADDECCMSGCAVCVYDLYEESLEAYDEALSTLRTSLSALDIPEYEWPSSVQTKESSLSSNGPSNSGKRKNTILSAFEEMERSLALKKQAGSGASS